MVSELELAHSSPYGPWTPVESIKSVEKASNSFGKFWAKVSKLVTHECQVDYEVILFFHLLIFFFVRQVRKLGVADVRPETLAAILARTDIVLDTYYVSN